MIEHSDSHNQPVKSQDADAGYLRLRITDFGPISKGEVVLKPLTVLTGPVGCGKSYVSTLIHTVIFAEVGKYSYFDLDANTLLYDKINHTLQDIVEKKPSHNNPYKLNITDMMGDIFSTAFLRLLEWSFLSSKSDLIRRGSNHFELDVQSKILDHVFSCSSNDTDTKTRSTMPHFIKFTQMGDTIFVDINKEKFDYKPSPVDNLLYYNLMREKIRTGLAEFYKKSVKIKHSIYFPAERAGLTVSYKSILAHLYSISNTIFREPPVLQLSGVLTSFLVDIHKHPDTDTEFTNIAKNFEARILNGEIISKQNASNTHEMYLRQGDATLPIPHTAAGVKSLAAFMLYLKHHAKRGDMVVLEEPESGLHPEGQILLARLLVQLTNMEIYVIITTHSQYILRQLNQCIAASTIRNKEKIKTLSENESIDSESIAAYRFAPDKGGYKIMPLDIIVDGISQDDFTNTDEMLYDELESIRDKPHGGCT